MSVVGFVTDAVAIGRILEHLVLNTAEAEKPPPVREIVRVAEHGEGWGRAGGVGVRRDERAVHVRKRAEGRDYPFPE